jgi:hypothetical protein
MKQFLVIFFAVLAGATLAMVGYDFLVLKPRAEALIAEQARVAAVAKLDLSQARDQAQAISQQLEQSVQKTIDQAEQAMTQQVDAQEQRRQFGEAFVRLSTLKTMVAESYANAGRWPENIKEVGMSEPAQYAGGAVKSIALGKRGELIMKMTAPFPDNAVIRLIPTANASTSAIEWRCEGSDFPDLARMMPQCGG